MPWQLCFCLSVIQLILFPSIVRAKDFQLKLLSNPKTSTSQDLIWDSATETQEPPLRSRFQPGMGPQYFVLLHGKYLKDRTTLLFESQPVHIGKIGEIQLEVPITSSSNSFKLIEITDDGQSNNIYFEVSFEKYDEFMQSENGHFTYQIGLGGLLYSAYEQYSGGIQTQTSGNLGIPSFSLGINHSSIKWAQHLEIILTYLEGSQGVSLPLAWRGTLELERMTPVLIYKSASLNILGQLSSEEFSQLAVNLTHSSLNSSLYVPRNTIAFWADLGVKLHFQNTVRHDSFLGATLGASPFSPSIANYDLGQLSSTLFGWHTKIWAQVFVHSNFYLTAGFEYLNLSQGVQINRTTGSAGFGYLF